MGNPARHDRRIDEQQVIYNLPLLAELEAHLQTNQAARTKCANIVRPLGLDTLKFNDIVFCNSFNLSEWPFITVETSRLKQVDRLLRA